MTAGMRIRALFVIATLLVSACDPPEPEQPTYAFTEVHARVAVSGAEKIGDTVWAPVGTAITVDAFFTQSDGTPASYVRDDAAKTHTDLIWNIPPLLAQDQLNAGWTSLEAGHERLVFTLAKPVDSVLAVFLQQRDDAKPGEVRTLRRVLFRLVTPPAAATALAVFPAAVSLGVGESRHVFAAGLAHDPRAASPSVAELTPEAATFTSDRPDVVSVDATGRLTARAIGDTTIHAVSGALSKDVAVHVGPAAEDALHVGSEEPLAFVTDKPGAGFEGFSLDSGSSEVGEARRGTRHRMFLDHGRPCVLLDGFATANGLSAPVTILSCWTGSGFGAERIGPAPRGDSRTFNGFQSPKVRATEDGRVVVLAIHQGDPGSLGRLLLFDRALDTPGTAWRTTEVFGASDVDWIQANEDAAPMPLETATELFVRPGGGVYVVSKHEVSRTLIDGGHCFPTLFFAEVVDGAVLKKEAIALPEYRCDTDTPDVTPYRYERAYEDWLIETGRLPGPSSFRDLPENVGAFIGPFREKDLEIRTNGHYIVANDSFDRAVELDPAGRPTAFDLVGDDVELFTVSEVVDDGARMFFVGGLAPPRLFVRPALSPRQLPTDPETSGRSIVVGVDEYEPGPSVTHVHAGPDGQRFVRAVKPDQVNAYLLRATTPDAAFSETMRTGPSALFAMANTSDGTIVMTDTTAGGSLFRTSRDGGATFTDGGLVNAHVLPSPGVTLFPVLHITPGFEVFALDPQSNGGFGAEYLADLRTPVPSGNAPFSVRLPALDSDVAPGFLTDGDDTWTVQRRNPTIDGVAWWAVDLTRYHAGVNVESRRVLLHTSVAEGFSDFPVPSSSARAAYGRVVVAGPESVFVIEPGATNAVDVPLPPGFDATRAGDSVAQLKYGAGKFWLFSQPATGPFRTVQYATSTDGRTWSTPTRVNPGGGRSDTLASITWDPVADRPVVLLDDTNFGRHWVLKAVTAP